ncbi:helix-turn-helix transcriptional regulator [Bradyrhizobium sp. LA6.7]|uniref:helix-turn-helix domain-containing protein n=3 Tax=Bradyrhizobium TaxID=374 RepID=UPI003393DDD6
MDIHRWMNPIKHTRCEVFGITQEEMAKICRVRQATISRWEAGIGEPSLRHVRLIRAEARRRRLRWDDRVFLAEERAA